MADTSIAKARYNVLDGVVTALQVVVILGTVKVVAIRFHQHGLAQAYLTLF